MSETASDLLPFAKNDQAAQAALASREGSSAQSDASAGAARRHAHRFDGRFGRRHV